MDARSTRSGGMASMTVDQIRDTVIKPKLVESFGGMMGSVFILEGSSAAMSAKTDKEKLCAMVGKICSNPKVKAMWGDALTAKRKAEWEGLL
jgi:hypothetical protein